MCDFSRVSAWFCDEKISLKKSCFYLYIRRRHEPGRNQTNSPGRTGTVRTPPQSNPDTKCTLTNAKDFAVGAYGLLLNSKAYAEAFHITGDYQTTWGNVIRIIAQKLQTQANIIDIPYH